LAEQREFEARAEVIRSGVATVPGIKAEIFVPEVANHVPHVRISWDEAARGMTASDAVNGLRAGEPSIGTRSEGAALVVGVWMMRPGHEKIVARSLRAVPAKRASRPWLAGPPSRRMVAVRTDCRAAWTKPSMKWTASTG